MSSIQNISLYIPHVFANYSKQDISDVFEKYVGEVKNIDLVSKIGAGGKKFNAVYIHFYNWYDDIANRNFQERVLDPNLEARIVYEDPWHWICLENKSRKVIAGERKPRIDIGDLNTSSKPTYANRCQMNHQHVQVQLTPDEISELDEAMEIQELEDAMDAEEAYLQEQDQYLVSVDWRYIHSIEMENNALRQQCAYMEGCFHQSNN